MRNEIPLPIAVINDVLTNWGQQKKAFRLIRRWSFEGDGFQFDLSIVHSTLKDAKGNLIKKADGTPKQTCKKIKVHKKLEGTEVPVKK